MPYCIVDILADPLKAFSVATLANITTVVNQTCPWDMLRPTMLNASDAFNLTTGNNFIFSDLLGPWMVYAARTIMSRLIDFKLPLLVLIFQLPRPPLGSRMQGFALLHFVSNPVDSMGSYFLALACSFRLLKRVEKEAKNMREANDTRWQARTDEEVKTDCKELSLVLITYATIGKPKDNVAEYATHPIVPTHRPSITNASSDRSASKLPTQQPSRKPHIPSPQTDASTSYLLGQLSSVSSLPSCSSTSTSTTRNTTTSTYSTSRFGVSLRPRPLCGLSRPCSKPPS